ncbi:unnamed protein product [Echinostoma caproni]|uniref:B30.2/SPRY domain-containing protein n=1 Tax=Echinostoma caproni TaxID=27848 RepID=A0A183AU50_9TREM|nr:unnamed protein product [Echinostoma caproni]
MAYPPGRGRISKEIDEYMLRIYKTDGSAPESQRLPKFWNTKDRSRHLRLSHFALSITYSGGFSERHDSNYTNGEAACARADAPIPLTVGIYYFEITISSRGGNGRSVAVGVATKASSLVRLPGTEHSSFAYHSDGSVFHGSPTLSSKFGPRFAENDTVGCGVDFISRSLFFTRNGVFLGKAFEGEIPASPGTRLYPAVGLQGHGTRLSTNFGQRPFSYAFEAHIKRERALHEKQLIDRVCKEEFAGPKMREYALLNVRGLSKHGSCGNATVPIPPNLKNSCFVAESPGTEPSTGGDSPAGTPSLVRRHSDSACLTLPSQSNNMLPLPGLASMLHRRRLRALCRRCQYGRAAATLNRLYPQVLERCPELLVQLRCRQLIEMMRRHAVRRDRNAAFDPASESSSTNSATAPPKVQKTSGAQNVRSGCYLNHSKLPQTTSSPRSPHHISAVESPRQQTSSAPAATSLPSVSNTSSMDIDEDDERVGSIPLGNTATSSPLTTTTKRRSEAELDEATPDTDEMRCLLRHVQFGRSLVNLVKQVRAKVGGLSLETERLLQDSKAITNILWAIE